MSVAIDTATKLHEGQVKAVTRSQDFVVSVVETAASALQGLRAVVPDAPAVVAGPIEKISWPVTKLVGTQDEVAAYVSRSVRDWTEAQQKFQSALLDAWLPAPKAAPAAKARAAKAKA